MQRTPVTSSNIASIGYDPDEKVLEVEFLDGSVYQYHGVPETHYRNLMVASSHGTYLDTYIKKGGFRYVKVR